MPIATQQRPCFLHLDIYIFGLYIDEMGLIFICNVALACYFSFNVLELSTKRRYLSLSLPLQLEKVIEII